MSVCCDFELQYRELYLVKKDNHSVIKFGKRDHNSYSILHYKWKENKHLHLFQKIDLTLQQLISLMQCRVLQTDILKFVDKTYSSSTLTSNYSTKLSFDEHIYDSIKSSRSANEKALPPLPLTPLQSLQLPKKISQTQTWKL